MRRAAFPALALGLLAAGSAFAQDAPGAPASGAVGEAPMLPGSAETPRDGERLLPVPTLGPTGDGVPAEGFPATADGAYGAFQRGLYLSALRIAEPLANLGDSAAQTLLGEIYAGGFGVPRDEAEAARWYRVAAEAGVPRAQFRYAMMLIEGEGVTPDEAAARDLMRQAADAGEPTAAFNYGQMLIQSSPTGGFTEAARYFRVAAESGVPDGQYALAQLYAYGQGETQDDTQARRWLREAAIRGHDTARVELGIWLINGRGGEANALAGFRWLKGAAERGNAIAINRVAHLYREGIGTPRDTQAAAMWAVLARRAGNTDPGLDGFIRGLPQDMQQRALQDANRFKAR
ncbi:tetratricopeptide repeat protein [Aureimonas mangrovi]|uniref:tetratricopeptide repeat protein n=1 Tax=Aureimonas mangrovi TaxID=2758041 RepID=UPI001FEB5004|nr:tetratricopeptide repeat protein [Aureimonas mangrovi]